MNITNIYKTCSVTDPIFVKVNGVTAGTKDAAIVDFAMYAVGETRQSLYGWSLTRYDDGTAEVRMNRD